MTKGKRRARSQIGQERTICIAAAGSECRHQRLADHMEAAEALSTNLIQKFLYRI